MLIKDCKKIYFLGIGGIGMSAVARYFSNVGKEIFGYDLNKTMLTKKLEAEGMTIHYNEDVSLIPEDIDMVVMTPAIPDTNSELIYLKEKSFEIKKRAEVLGMISRNSRTIAIAGTHGKTTTSSVLSHILNECKLDVTAFLGGILSKEKTNFICGNSDIVVLEADEYDRSFLQLTPETLAILSMDPDHLDIYGTVEEMRDAYRQLTKQIKVGGTLILAAGLKEHFSIKLIEELENKKINIITQAKEFEYKNIEVVRNQYQFDFKDEAVSISEVRSTLAGVHNISNVSVAMEIALVYGAAEDEIKKAVSSFQGISRRFEIVYSGSKILVDDYAHHPVEVKCAISTVKTLYSDKKVLGIFQPHLYSRTLDFYKEFAQELSHLDEVWLLPIYPAREKPIEGVKSELIYNLIRNRNKKLVLEEDIESELEKIEFDVIITIGASDLNKHHSKIIKYLKE